jgi:hypothetical protein
MSICSAPHVLLVPRPNARDCDISSCLRSNWCIVPDEEANVEVEDCDFVNFPGRGISAQTTGEVIIRRCRFSHGIKEAQAVVSRAGSKTLVEECVFEQPNVSYAAVSALPMPNRPVSTEGYLKVMNCTFRNFKLTAVYIKGS